MSYLARVVGSYTLLTRLSLKTPFCIRLECVRHVATVDLDPGPNSMRDSCVWLCLAKKSCTLALYFHFAFSSPNFVYFILSAFSPGFFGVSFVLVMGCSDLSSLGNF